MNRKGHSSIGTALVSTNSAATKMVSTITQTAKKRKVPHCSTHTVSCPVKRKDYAVNVKTLLTLSVVKEKLMVNLSLPLA